MHDANDFPFCHYRGDKMADNTFERNNECQISEKAST